MFGAAFNFLERKRSQEWNESMRTGVRHTGKSEKQNGQHGKVSEYPRDRKWSLNEIEGTISIYVWELLKVLFKMAT